jgi:hypothetical protein
MLRRHAQSKLMGLAEHVLAVLWAIATVLALLGASIWPAPLLIVAFVLVVAQGGMKTALSRYSATRSDTGLATE